MRSSAFPIGFLLGTGLGVSAFLLGPETIQTLWQWVDTNLGHSIWAFGLTLILFLHALWLLQDRVQRQAPPEAVAQAETLTDVWIGVFFGVGVIWTAIGMREALLFALGDPELTRAEGAYSILQRLVEGGILVALSTTIVGGIGGYLMRVIKTLLTGASLQAYYNAHALAQGDETLSVLRNIETRLAIRQQDPRLERVDQAHTVHDLNPHS